MNSKKILSLVLTAFLVATPFIMSGCGKDETIIPYQMTLEVWGVFDDSDALKAISKSFADSNSTIEHVNYKKISNSSAEFEKELIDAFASGNGPDVFFFNNLWLKKHGNKIAPMPKSEAYLVKHKDEFVDVVHGDFFRDGQVNALPLYCDTLALYYNKHLLNQAGITSPPATWEELKSQIKMLTKIDEFGNIKQSAIALGRSKSPGAINRASDILLLMMLQNGAALNNPNNIDFSKSIGNAKGNPGISALEFYTQFGQANSSLYTWNNKMHYSDDAFQDSEVAMVIGYPYKKDQFKKAAPKLDFDVAPIPQLDLDNKVNFANYWGLAVAKSKNLPSGARYTNKDRIKEAWNYVKYVTTKPANPKDDATLGYLRTTGKIAARKDILEIQKDESFKGIFATQALTAKSWIVPDEIIADEVLVEAIDSVANGELTPKDAIGRANSKLQAIWK